MANDAYAQRSIQITASNGVTWTRRAGGTSSGAQFLEALSVLTRMNSDVALLWDWWEEDRHDQEHDRVWAVLGEWDNGAPEPEHTDEDPEAFKRRLTERVDMQIEAEKQRRADLVARSYDKERAGARLQLLRHEADAAFFQHVIDKPANAAQREDAKQRFAKSQAEADALRSQVGDPDEVIDEEGYLPAERRKRHLDEHMRYWRYPALRELRNRDRRRFNTLLKMAVPDVTSMCSECQAPAGWHEYDISLCLFRAQPPQGSTAEAISRLMPGWWERCAACTAYRIGHVWGGPHALPDFTGEQWRAMLPTLLRTIFAPGSVKKKPVVAKSQPLATVPPGPIAEVMAKLRELETKHPTAEVRQGRGGQWELWPTRQDADK